MKSHKLGSTNKLTHLFKTFSPFKSENVNQPATVSSGVPSSWPLPQPPQVSPIGTSTLLPPPVSPQTPEESLLPAPIVDRWLSAKSGNTWRTHRRRPLTPPLVSIDGLRRMPLARWQRACCPRGGRSSSLCWYASC